MTPTRCTNHAPLLPMLSAWRTLPSTVDNKHHKQRHVKSLKGG